MHQFCYTDKGWREKLIDVNSTSGSTAGPASKKPQVITTNPRIAAAKKEVLSRHTAGGEGAVEAPTESNKEAKIEAVGTPAPEFHFRFVLSPSPTPAVRSLLMNTKPTVAAAAAGVSTSGASTSAEGSIDAKEGGADHISSNPDDHSVVSASTVVAAPQVGDGLEVSPLAIATCEDAAARVVKCGGAALFIDYGEDHTQEDSLRAFYRHKQVSVLSQVSTERGGKHNCWCSPLALLSELLPLSFKPFYI